MLAATNYILLSVRNIIGRDCGDTVTIGQRLVLCVPFLKLSDNK